MKTDVVGWLVYPPLKQRRSDNSFMGNSNTGARVVMHELLSHGIKIHFCDPSTANNYRLVCASATSTYDLIALRKLSLVPGWDQRKFKLLVGGAGITNPWSLCGVADYVAIGRVEDVIADDVDRILCGHIPCSDCVARMADYPHNVSLGWSSRLCSVGSWHEDMVGCRVKCKFCQYAWTRNHVGRSEYRVDWLGGSPEVMLTDIKRITHKHGVVRAAVDGFSERLRMLYGKPILDADIVSAIEALGQFGGRSRLMLYNVGNMPGETLDDIAQLESVVASANPVGRVVVVVHTTPFRPSNLTPMQWEGARVDVDLRAVCASRTFVDRANLLGIHSHTIEAQPSHVECVVYERATRTSGYLLDVIARACGMSTSDRMAVLREHGATDYLREYAVDDDAHPCANISTPYRICAVARSMRRRAAHACPPPKKTHSHVDFS